ncbi:hypothetical protein BS47DRAFT_1416717 [Hydnum rufescens UP504]|uniref:Purine nucleoside phosphorylase n=1 Tax=Hydnum rufescens UP504 TaxID=1448309 RepID=A0A9P6AMU1_9AGAM|nr:hypothetical protein BS47DRAFT_1416717 [Hydnum rufescens UP504]
MAPDTALHSSFGRALETIHSRLPPSLREPRIAIVCGSGLATLAASMREQIVIPYADLDGFANSTVSGHTSALAFGFLGAGNDIPVVAMLGRLHPYEGHPLSDVVYPIRLMALLGIKDIIITNAAGGLNPNFPIGTIVVVQDHIALPNLTGPFNALQGPVLAPPFSARFVPLSAAYSFELRKTTFRVAHALGFPRSALAEGTYAWVSGPTYETPAEGRFLRSIGGDVVGMSTVPEVVAARQAGMQVLVLSLVTNAVVIPDTYISPRDEFEAEVAGHHIPKAAAEEVTHAEVLEVGRRKAESMRALVEGIVEARAAEGEAAGAHAV